MANCPLCSDILLRHIRSGQTYWFCRRCRVESFCESCQNSPSVDAGLTSLSGEPATSPHSRSTRFNSLAKQSTHADVPVETAS